MMNAAIGCRLKVTGNRSATVSAGPMPGSTPTNVPSVTPASAHKRLIGVSAMDEASRATIEEMMVGALAAKDELARRFYEPSLRRRAELVAKQQAGELAEDALPRDLLTMIARDPSRFDTPDDPDGNFVMAFNLFSGATGTNTQTLVHAVDSIERWVAAHPEDRGLRTDVAFVERAPLNESPSGANDAPGTGA